METKLLLVKCITLLYRESQMPDLADSSNETIDKILIDTVVSDIPSTERDMILGLKNLLAEMTSSPKDYDLNSLLQSIKMIDDEREKLYDALCHGVEAVLSEAQLKRTVINLRRTINIHLREKEINKVLFSAYSQFRDKRDQIKDLNVFIEDLITKLEPLQLNSSIKDPAVMSEIDVGDEKGVANIYEEIKNTDDGKIILKTGWQDLNDMTQGGLRRGETTLIGALQHKYKTGFTLSLFQQIALNNKPYMFDAGKKPLLLRFSFEDDLTNNLHFIYQLLKFEETNRHVEIRDTTVANMSGYVRERLQTNGYHVKMLRVDPSLYSYRQVCNKVVELEAQGYEIHLAMMDYLFKLPTIGCITSGPLGHDKRDMLRRMRNFFAARKTAFVTPAQLSSEAKQLIRGGLPEDRFVKEVAEKGYWDGCKSLDQEADLELHIHLFKHRRETFFSVQRGKHRLPTVIDDDLKYMLMKFPKKGMPIPSDINGEKISFRKLSEAPGANEEIEFNF